MVTPLPDQEPAQAGPTVVATASPVQISPRWGPGAYPRLAALADGRLLGTVTSFAGERRALRLAHSRDGGASFADLALIAEGHGDLDNAHLVELRQVVAGGSAPRLLAAYRNHVPEPDGSAIFRIGLSASDDGGQVWSKLADVHTARPPFGLWEPFLLVDPAGGLQIYYAAENADKSQNIVLRSSHDNGHSWGSASTVATGAEGRDGMPGVALLPQPHGLATLAVFEHLPVGAGACQIVARRSDDGGLAWGPRQIVHQAAPGAFVGAPQLAVVAGRPVISLMSSENEPHAEGRGRADRSALKVVVGEPGLGSWSAPATVAPKPAWWPGLLAGSQSRLWVTYSGLAVRAQLQ